MFSNAKLAGEPPFINSASPLLKLIHNSPNRLTPDSTEPSSLLFQLFSSKVNNKTKNKTTMF
jgi:hypothetical protein